MPVVALTPHPSTPVAVEWRLGVDARRIAGGELALTFRLEGALAGLAIPPPCPPRRADRLWQHTCFEAFVAVAGAAAYRELNLSPSGEWALYAFARYREPMAATQEPRAPHAVVTRAPDRLQLDAVLSLEPGSAEHEGARLRLGLSAVLETTDGALSYWALRHPPGAPDFHHPDAFVLEL